MSVSLSKRAGHRNYYRRTGANTRAATIIAQAINDQPEFFEDEDGNRIRAWKPEELSSYTHDDIAQALRGVSICEPEELLGRIPPSAIKYAQTKGWLRQGAGGWLQVTLRAANDFDLPRTVRGRKIRFAE